MGDPRGGELRPLLARHRPAPFICFSGIAPTVGDVAIGQSILGQLKARLALPVHVHSNRPQIFGALPELGSADECRPPLAAPEPPSARSPAFPMRLAALIHDLRRTGGAHRLPPTEFEALRAALSGCAALVLQGGPTWNDRMTDRRRALRRWLLLETARYYGARVYHVGVSCGPFRWPMPSRMWMAPLVRRALDTYDLLIVRDQFSRPALQRLGVRTRVVESTDAAVFLPSSAAPAYADLEARIGASSRRRVVVCVRDYQDNYPEARAVRDAALRQLAAVLDELQRDRADVFFLSTDHTPQPGKETDVEIARRVQAMMRTPGSAVIDEHVQLPSALKYLYAQFDAMISMRLHPTILALERGVPSLLLSYDPKCADFFGRLQLEDFHVPLADFHQASALALVARLLDQPGLRRDIVTRVGALKAAHAGDYEMMCAQIAERAAALAAGASRGRAHETQAAR